MRTINDTNKGAGTLLAFALIPLSGFALDVYIPSLPHMAEQLKTTPAAIQLTLSVYLIAYGICQLFIGALLDSFGRYRPSLFALLCFSLSSFVIARAHDLSTIYLMRALQGIMVATIVVSKRSFFVDMYSGEKLKHYTSLFSVIWAAAPIIAPFIGGYLQLHFGWQSNFYFLGFFGLFLFVLELLFSGETLKEAHPFHLPAITNTYLSMIKAWDFVAALLILALAYSMLLVYNMASPFIIEQVLHYPASVTGNCALLSGVSMMVGGLLSKYYISKHFTRKITTVLGLQLTAALVLIGITFYVHNLFTLLAYVMLLHMFSGFVFNTLFSYSLTRFTHHGGKASGLAGGGYIIFTSAFSYLVAGGLTVRTQVGLGISYAVLTTLILIIFLTTKWHGVPRYKKQMSGMVAQNR
ncbi:MFS transporter [Chitinophaga sedimenti]|uniref:MFS transporter n=1 Tax=Chitinophaga sedimenti TaxID=2033606 RepID=UPI002004FC1C|nr:MFS transporter [Chitinophaga sedimenti]MCK7556440.1 MFS transporter [Chitinophaga sedimenti]